MNVSIIYLTSLKRSLDSINREILFEAMKELELPGTVVRVIQTTLIETTANVPTTTGDTETFNVNEMLY